MEKKVSNSRDPILLPASSSDLNIYITVFGYLLSPVYNNYLH